MINMDKKKLNDLDYALSVCLKYIMIILVIVALIYILIGCSCSDKRRVVTNEELTKFKEDRCRVELLDEYNNPTDTILCYSLYFSTQGGTAVTLKDKDKNVICKLVNVKIKLTYVE